MIAILIGAVVQTEIRDAILMLAQMLEAPRSPERAPLVPVVERVLFTDGPVCVICLEPHGSCAVAAQCGHCFHRACIERWAQQSRMCPVCRSDLGE
jgi:hypothetical protein